MTTDHTAPAAELREGVPDTLRAPLTDWLAQQLARESVEGAPYDRPLLPAIEEVFRVHVGSAGDPQTSFQSLIAQADANPALYLDVVDLVLSRLGASPNTAVGDHAAIAALDRILADASSVWTVATSLPSNLERRVPPPVSALARTVIESSTPAGAELRSAWRYAWGRRPNASEAYRAALRVVEYAFAPLVTRGGPPPTLGDLIAMLRAQLAQFELDPAADETLPDAQSVVASLELLQQGMSAGLAAGYPYDPLTVTRGQAQAATVLAARLAHLVQTAAFARRG